MSSLLATPHLENAIKFRELSLCAKQKRDKNLPLLIGIAVAKVVRAMSPHSTLVGRILNVEAVIHLFFFSVEVLRRVNCVGQLVDYCKLMKRQMGV